MPYTIDHDERGFIHLRFESPDSLDEHFNAVKDIHQLVAKNNCKNIAVNLFTMGQTNLRKEDQFSFTQSWDPDIVQGCRFAIIVPSEQQHQDDWYFMIHFIKETGTIGQPFYELEKAVDWLVER